MRLEKKTTKEFFEKIASGEKNFDVRLADFECRSGDTIVLKEWDEKKGEYTGRKLEREVSFVLNTKDLSFWNKKDVQSFGYQVLALK